jgi:glycosyltransferase involved in cell wall biosynthesis
MIRVMYPAALTPGGAERQMLLLAERLPADRFQVSFVVLGRDTPLADEARALGATVHILGVPRRRETPPPVFAAKVASRVLGYIRLCRRERYDIVDAWLYHGYGLAAMTRPLTGVPVLVSGRRSLSGFKERFGPLERAVDAVARRASDAFVANSEAVADDVARRERIARHRIRVIRNGVEVPEPLDEARRRTIRAGWGVPASSPVIGVIGTMKRGKGQDRVVRAMPGLLEAVPEVRLVLLGDGPERPELEALVTRLGLGDRVLIVGSVPSAWKLYGALDMVASASDAEGMPNVVLEAAAAARAIVATDAGGTREIVADGETGILVPVGDDAALGRALVGLLRQPEERARLGRAARARAIAEFGVERFVNETAAFYHEIVTASRRTGAAVAPRAPRR